MVGYFDVPMPMPIENVSLMLLLLTSLECKRKKNSFKELGLETEHWHWPGRSNGSEIRLRMVLYTVQQCYSRCTGTVIFMYRWHSIDRNRFNMNWIRARMWWWFSFQQKISFVACLLDSVVYLSSLVVVCWLDVTKVTGFLIMAGKLSGIFSRNIIYKFFVYLFTVPVRKKYSLSNLACFLCWLPGWLVSKGKMFP